MLRITGGKIYDPANGIDGRVGDLCIDGGRFVESVEGGRTIDATGMIVFPGGVDVHTHVAGGAINFARAMTPEDHRRTQAFMRTKTRRSGLGGMAPTTFATGYLYAGMGWTTVNEAAVPVLSARHTHEELSDIPIVDKTSLTLMANNEILLDQLEGGEYERARNVVAWYLRAAKSYGVKAVNPGGVTAWKYGKDAKQLTSPIEGYHRLTPGAIVTQLAGICDDLGLPHPMHLHCNNLGAPGNISTTLDTLKHLEGRRAHIAHSQYHAYGGDDWDTMRSASAELANYFNTHPSITTDAGAVLFGDTVTITADGPWQHLLYKLTGRKWGNLDVENETGCGIVPYTYRPSNLVNGVQWAVGLELLLLIENPWQVFLSTDHPNGGCFWRYPEIIKLLMCADFRKECLQQMPDRIKSRIMLPEIDREYTLFEIATAMSAGPARALGLPRKGNLGVGCDADLVIYEEDEDVSRMFGHPRYVIKGGEVVIEEGDILETPDGREFLVNPACDEDIDDFIKPLFEDCYTMSFDNYAVELERIEHAEWCECIESERS
ncbi:MAG: formylmethanofuran dehydrogenase subunit A [Planctomycetota bacterium]|mgnify:CR=1 FL=1|nr:MAG: formylmethanofuran dehydrogenase subunit A [Planctomycetota bacterium]REJ98646.1 MAG: formylmethanofuran dehydrogenase subunit A [Planctomycetota bacterium]REK26369.1 MAG: formylmethanofuran dehydrogenase subunit A [Planctomycetota bacterium]